MEVLAAPNHYEHFLFFFFSPVRIMGHFYLTAVYQCTFTHIYHWVLATSNTASNQLRKTTLSMRHSTAASCLLKFHLNMHRNNLFILWHVFFVFQLQKAVWGIPSLQWTMVSFSGNYLVSQHLNYPGNRTPDWNGFFSPLGFRKSQRGTKACGTQRTGRNLSKSTSNLSKITSHTCAYISFSNSSTF